MASSENVPKIGDSYRLKSRTARKLCGDEDIEGKVSIVEDSFFYVEYELQGQPCRKKVNVSSMNLEAPEEDPLLFEWLWGRHSAKLTTTEEAAKKADAEEAEAKVLCSKCNGTGKKSRGLGIVKRSCDACKGTGKKAAQEAARKAAEDAEADRKAAMSSKEAAEEAAKEAIEDAEAARKEAEESEKAAQEKARKAAEEADAVRKEAEKATKAQPFSVGDLVERRDGSEPWEKGYVTSVHPLKVTFSVVDPAEKGYSWDEVRHIEVFSREKVGQRERHREADEARRVQDEDEARRRKVAEDVPHSHLPEESCRKIDENKERQVEPQRQREAEEFRQRQEVEEALTDSQESEQADSTNAEATDPNMFRVNHSGQQWEDNLAKFCCLFLDALRQHHGPFQRQVQLIERTVGQNHGDQAQELRTQILLALGGDAYDIEDALMIWKKTCGQLHTNHFTSPLPQREGAYQWIRKENDQNSRNLRLKAALATIAFGSMLVDTNWLEKTCFVHAAGDQSRIIYRNTELLSLSHSPKTVLEEALELASHNSRIAIVSAGTAHHVGGGFLSGGRHALEEATCLQSTLFFSLLKARRDAKKKRLSDSQRNPLHIPEDGIVFTPDVNIFREGSAAGYSWRDKIVTVAAVLSVAMPNKNHDVHDTPYDDREGPHYEKLLKDKWIAVLKGATKANVDTLIVPDAGCSVFHNDPTNVGNALGDALLDYAPPLKRIVVTGAVKFFDAVQMRFASGLSTGGCVFWKVREGRQLRVHDGPELVGTMLPTRLASLSVVKELETKLSTCGKQRLHYMLQSGSGPTCGWVSLDMLEKASRVEAAAYAKGIVAKQAEGYPEVRLWSSAGSRSSTVVANVPNGELLTVLEEQDEDVKVRWNEHQGWVNVKNVAPKPQTSVNLCTEAVQEKVLDADDAEPARQETSNSEEEEERERRRLEIAREGTEELERTRRAEQDAKRRPREQERTRRPEERARRRANEEDERNRRMEEEARRRADEGKKSAGSSCSSVSHRSTASTTSGSSGRPSGGGEASDSKSNSSRSSRNAIDPQVEPMKAPEPPLQAPPLPSPPYPPSESESESDLYGTGHVQEEKRERRRPEIARKGTEELERTRRAEQDAKRRPREEERTRRPEEQARRRANEEDERNRRMEEEAMRRADEALSALRTELKVAGGDAQQEVQTGTVGENVQSWVQVREDVQKIHAKVHSHRNLESHGESQKRELKDRVASLLGEVEELQTQMGIVVSLTALPQQVTCVGEKGAKFAEGLEADSKYGGQAKEEQLLLGLKSNLSKLVGDLELMSSARRDVLTNVDVAFKKLDGVKKNVENLHYCVKQIRNESLMLVQGEFVDRLIELHRELSVIVNKLKHLNQGGDSPGTYTITSDDIVVTVELTGDTKTKVEAQFFRGMIVDVLEVSALHRERIVRGRLENPKGWITLFDTSTRHRWAEKDDTTDSSKLHQVKEDLKKAKAELSSIRETKKTISKSDVANVMADARALEVRVCGMLMRNLADTLVLEARDLLQQVRDFIGRVEGELSS